MNDRNSYFAVVFSRELDRWKKENSKSQEDFAVDIGLKGKNMITRYKKGEAYPEPETLDRICNVLGVEKSIFYPSILDNECLFSKGVFEAAYRQTDGMNFGLAIEAMKKGYRVARDGWNGKNMSVAYQKGYPYGIPCNKNTAEAWGMKEGELFKCRPYLQMRCADGTFQMWLASQSDILADDWYIVV